MNGRILSFLLVLTLSGLTACIPQSGACVSQDGARSYCFEDEDESMCDGYDETFYADSSCAGAGYPYYCTNQDMRESGAPDGYYIPRYLNNSSCNPYGASGSSGGSNSSGGGNSCAQCAYDETCVDADGRAMCLADCSSDSQCGGTCCVPLQNGGAVCAPSYDWCEGSPTNNGGTGNTCDDYTHCLEMVEILADGRCNSDTGATATVRNNCSHNVDYSGCLSTTPQYGDSTCDSGDWECWGGVVGPGETFNLMSCTYTGSYKMIGTRAASDGGDPIGCLDGCASWE